ncbi:MAG: type II toxin-antitoxin system Phd/YefM family antitoxin [Acidobacteria bacterium]|nr:type II toxin-antitoxin system Phd/YefM family antitoxin [Acidobacteriota bacterium]
MKAVGLRELKNRLSKYVRQVQSGDAVLVTDRGQVVAELRPPGQFVSGATTHPGLSALARTGRVSLAAGQC